MATIKPKVTHRYCPDCGYMLSQRQIAYAKENYPCPDCQGPRYSEFLPMDAEQFGLKTGDRDHETSSES